MSGNRRTVGVGDQRKEELRDRPVTGRQTEREDHVISNASAERKDKS